MKFGWLCVEMVSLAHKEHSRQGFCFSYTFVLVCAHLGRADPSNRLDIGYMRISCTSVQCVRDNCYELQVLR